MSMRRISGGRRNSTDYKDLPVQLGPRVKFIIRLPDELMTLRFNSLFGDVRIYL
jgi:hypothetical protein